MPREGGSHPMRRPGLGFQLGVAFAAVAAFTALLATVFVAMSWQQTFESYVRQRVQADAVVLADSAGSSYDPSAGWNVTALVDLAALGKAYGLRVQMMDSAGRVLVDSDALPSSSALPGVTLPSGEVASTTAGSGPMREPIVVVPVYSDQTQVGSVRVASTLPGSFLNESDRQFRTASTLGLGLAALLAVFLASGAGLLYSRRYTRPIESLTRTAAALRAGSRGARTGMTGEDAVGSLGRMLDEMADSIEAEREFERRLTADVAHELRTPLQAIQATVEAMQDGVLPADGEHLGVVRDETVRLGRLTESILELSRLENRSATFRMVEVDPAVPLQRAVETHRALFDSLELDLETDITDGALVEADTDRLTQAFGNLISNAARYTPEGGKVVVRLVADAKSAVMSVCDTGIGIAEEDRERVFTRFWRSARARESGRGGLGIGLAVVREIVEQHGGTVSFHGNEPEPGTTFEVSLPVLRKRQKV
jgi:two-component system, OmpR family, sensor histidine kinase BaeS